MRLLHTSDWHVGVTLGGKERVQEHAVFLEELQDIIREEKIETVLISGDLFDQPNPPADAEKLVYDFFRHMAERKIPVIVIAGNHDSGARIEGKARLLQLVQVHAFGKPQKDAKVEILSSKSERLIVATLPFTGELRVLESESGLKQDPGQQKAGFAETIKGFLSLLSKRHFQPDTINVLMAHLTVDGSALSGSEKNLRMSDAWTIPSPMLPSDGHYIALGHIHKAQEIPDSPVRCAYSGSPLHIDFGEEKDEKGVFILEAEAGKPVQSAFHPLKRLTPLVTVRTTLKNLQETAARFKETKGYLKVIVSLDEDDKKSGISEEVRRLLPQTIFIATENPKTQEFKPLANVAALVHTPIEAYKLYLESQGRQATPDLVEALQKLIEDIHHASANT